MSRLPPLRIDFARGRDFPRLRHAVLAAGTIALTACAGWHFEISSETERVQAQVEEMSRMLRRTAGSIGADRKDGKALQQEIGAANSVIRQMTIPWGQLFGELEATAGEDVALLAVQPDAASGAVRISGEARNFNAMVGYSRRLEGSEVLDSVVLLAHEVKAQDPQRPVAFTLTANWSERR